MGFGTMIVSMRKQAACMALILIASVSILTEPTRAQTKALPRPGEVFAVGKFTAFSIEPADSARLAGPMPWVWYAPTLKGLPSEAETWMFDRFLSAGIAIAGIDVGESYGSPTGRAGYQALYESLTTQRGYAERPVLLARSRGGLMLYSWAVEHPEAVAAIAGIYPVCNLTSYPGLARSAPAFQLTEDELAAQLSKHNPIDRLAPLALAKVPILHLHGDQDKVVPLAANSGELGARYAALGGPVEISVIAGQGHNMWSGWFRSQQLTDFVLTHALKSQLPDTKQTPPATGMSWLDNGQIRLGVDLSIGGAITHLSEVIAGVPGKNMINSHDWGRQIQMSFYSGPVPFVPDGATVADAWKALGWNPIQSGDFYANRSRVSAQHNDGEELYVRCTPMQWPLKNVPGECEFECWFRLDGNTVRARCRLTNQRTDETQYRGRAQELPAVYTNGEWFKLVSYLGDQPFSGAEPTLLVERGDGRGWPWRQFQTSEHWAALLNEHGRGLGVYSPEACAFTGGFAGQPKGSGGSLENPTGYMTPTIAEVLDHDIVYTYDYTLIVGSLEEIRAHVYEREQDRSLPHWMFARDRQHWTLVNTTDEGWPIRDGLRVRLGPSNAALVSQKTFWRAEAAPTLSLRAAFTTSATSAKLLLQPYDELAAGDWAQWGEERALRPKPGPPVVVPFTIVGDGQVRTLQIDLAGQPNYVGGMTQVKLLLPSGPGSARIFAVDLRASAAEAEALPPRK
ncbi:MAG: hypothetical protein ACI9HE_002342 [Planctomycetota bacterium]|jgi:hypothetical protein